MTSSQTRSGIGLGGAEIPSKPGSGGFSSPPARENCGPSEPLVLTIGHGAARDALPHMLALSGLSFLEHRDFTGLSVPGDLRPFVQFLQNRDRDRKGLVLLALSDASVGDKLTHTVENQTFGLIAINDLDVGLVAASLDEVLANSTTHTDRRRSMVRLIVVYGRTDSDDELVNRTRAMFPNVDDNIMHIPNVEKDGGTVPARIKQLLGGTA